MKRDSVSSVEVRSGISNPALNSPTSRRRASTAADNSDSNPGLPAWQDIVVTRTRQATINRTRIVIGGSNIMSSIGDRSSPLCSRDRRRRNHPRPNTATLSFGIRATLCLPVFPRLRPGSFSFHPSLPRKRESRGPTAYNTTTGSRALDSRPGSSLG